MVSTPGARRARLASSSCCDASRGAACAAANAADSRVPAGMFFSERTLRMAVMTWRSDLELLDGGLVRGVRRQGPGGIDQRLAPCARLDESPGRGGRGGLQVLPQLLGDKGHEGMQQAQAVVEHAHQRVRRALSARRAPPRLAVSVCSLETSRYQSAYSPQRNS